MVCLVEGDAPNNDYVRGKVVSISDVQVDPVNVSRSITFSDQKVEDVGTHSAGLKAHYTIDEKLLPDVANVLQHGLLRVFSVQGKATNSDWQVCLGSPLWDCTTGRVDDDPAAQVHMPKYVTLLTVMPRTSRLSVNGSIVVMMWRPLISRHLATSPTSWSDCSLIRNTVTGIMTPTAGGLR